MDTKGLAHTDKTAKSYFTSSFKELVIVGAYKRDFLKKIQDPNCV